MSCEIFFHSKLKILQRNFKIENINNERRQVVLPAMARRDVARSRDGTAFRDWSRDQHFGHVIKVWAHLISKGRASYRTFALVMGREVTQLEVI